MCNDESPITFDMQNFTINLTIFSFKIKSLQNKS